MSRKTVIVTAGRRARAGAPWIFSNEIQMDAGAKALAPGALVDVRDNGGAALGTGMFNPKSLIAVRLLSPDCGTVIDVNWITERIGRALALRERFYQEPYYRLVHGEGDGLPGLVIDRFGDTVSIQIGSAGMQALEGAILAALDKLIAPATVMLRNDAPSRALEGLAPETRLARGTGGRIRVRENGLQYFADLAEGQKTGWYYDQRDNRAFIAGLAKDKSVLDAYSYSGGFGLLAAKAGAREVMCLDSSAPALALAEESASANGVKITPLRADVTETLERFAADGETFDIVLADPPPFVRAKKDVEAGARAYRKVARLAALATAKEGMLMLASCSHNMSMERFVNECAAGIARTRRSARLIRAAGAGIDHPVHPALPESAYLKALVYALD